MLSKFMVFFWSLFLICGHINASKVTEGEVEGIVRDSAVRIEQALTAQQFEVPYLLTPNILEAKDRQGLSEDLHVMVQENFDFINSVRPTVGQTSGEIYQMGKGVLQNLEDENHKILSFLRLLKHLNMDEMPDGPMGKSVLMGAMIKKGEVGDAWPGDFTNATTEKKEQFLFDKVGPQLIEYQLSIFSINFAEIAYRFTDKEVSEVCNDAREEFKRDRNRVFIMQGARNYAQVANEGPLNSTICQTVNEVFSELSAAGELRYLKVGNSSRNNRLNRRKAMRALRERVFETYYKDLNAELARATGTVRYVNKESGVFYDNWADVPKGDVRNRRIKEVVQLDDSSYQIYGDAMEKAIGKMEGAFGMLVGQVGVAPTQSRPYISIPQLAEKQLIPMNGNRKLFRHLTDADGNKIANRVSFAPIDIAREDVEYTRAMSELYQFSRHRLGYFLKMSSEFEVVANAVDQGPEDNVLQLWRNTLVGLVTFKRALTKDQLESKRRELRRKVRKLREDFFVDAVRLAPLSLGGVLASQPPLASLLPKLVDEAQKKQRRLDTANKVLEVVGISTVAVGQGTSVAHAVLRKASSKIFARAAGLTVMGSAGSVITGASLAMKSVLTAGARLLSKKKAMMLTTSISSATWASAAFAKSMLYKEHYLSMLHSVALKERMPDKDFLQHMRSFRSNRNWAIAMGLLNAVQIVGMVPMLESINKLSWLMRSLREASRAISISGPSQASAAAAAKGSSQGVKVLRDAFQNTRTGLQQLPGLSPAPVGGGGNAALVAVGQGATASQKTVQVFSTLFSVTDQMSYPERGEYLSEVVNGLRVATPDELQETFRTLSINCNN